MKVYIYTLADPRSNEVRYIGKANRIKKRLKKHLWEKSNSKRVNWISSLKKLKLKPIIEVIDKVDDTEWQFWETFYISLFRSWNFNLLNGTDGGEGGPSFKNKKHSDKTKKAISLKLKNKKRPNCSQPGFKNGRCKVTEEIVIEIRRLAKEKMPLSRIGKLYNLRGISVKKIVNKERFKNIAG